MRQNLIKQSVEDATVRVRTTVYYTRIPKKVLFSTLTKNNEFVFNHKMIEVRRNIPDGFLQVPSQAEITRGWREAIAAKVCFPTEEKLRYALPNVNIHAQQEDEDEGGLQDSFSKMKRIFLTSTRLVLVDPEGGSIIIEYPSIILHSVVATPPEIYCQLDLQGLQRDGQDVEVGEESFLELHIGVGETDPIELYEALCECACLHPGGDGDEDDGGYGGEDEYRGEDGYRGDGGVEYDDEDEYRGSESEDEDGDKEQASDGEQASDSEQVSDGEQVPDGEQVSDGEQDKSLLQGPAKFVCLDDAEK